MDYLFGRMLLGFLGLVSLVLIIVGITLALGGIGIGVGLTFQDGVIVGAPTALVAAIPGLCVSLFGFLLMAMVDHFNATLDSASNSKKLVQIAEQQLQVSRQALKVGALAVPGYADMSGDERERLVDARSDKSGFFGLFSGGAKKSRQPIEPAALGKSSERHEVTQYTTMHLEDHGSGDLLSPAQVSPHKRREPVNATSDA